MKKEQFEKYIAIKTEVDKIKGFLVWCGKKYKDPLTSHFPIRVIGRKVLISVGRKGLGGLNDTEIQLPWELQQDIIEVIEKYVERREREMEEI